MVMMEIFGWKGRRCRGVGSVVCGMDGWLTCVIACIDESGSDGLGCLMGDKGILGGRET